VTLEAAETRRTFLVCVVYAIERDGALLLLRRSREKDHAPGEWETGSGGILPGESPQAAVIREAREETGLHVEVVDVIDAFHFYRGADRAETIGITFHCRITAGTFTLSDEHEEAAWIPLTTVATGNYPDWLQRIARRIESRPTG
jgi:8-oxo-dGTP pyrophosphatase MutT (NUDIX family)